MKILDNIPVKQYTIDTQDLRIMLSRNKWYTNGTYKDIEGLNTHIKNKYLNDYEIGLLVNNIMLHTEIDVMYIDVYLSLKKICNYK